METPVTGMKARSAALYFSSPLSDVLRSTSATAPPSFRRSICSVCKQLLLFIILSFHIALYIAAEGFSDSNSDLVMRCNLSLPCLHTGWLLPGWGRTNWNGCVSGSRRHGDGADKLCHKTKHHKAPVPLFCCSIINEKNIIQRKVFHPWRCAAALSLSYTLICTAQHDSETRVTANINSRSGSHLYSVQHVPFGHFYYPVFTEAQSSSHSKPS